MFYLIYFFIKRIINETKEVPETKNTGSNGSPKRRRPHFIALFLLTSILYFLYIYFNTNFNFVGINANSIELLTKVVCNYETVTLITAWMYFLYAKSFDDECLDKAIAITLYIKIFALTFTIAYGI